MKIRKYFIIIILSIVVTVFTTLSTFYFLAKRTKSEVKNKTEFYVLDSLLVEKENINELIIKEKLYAKDTLNQSFIIKNRYLQMKLNEIDIQLNLIITKDSIPTK